MTPRGIRSPTRGISWRRSPSSGSPPDDVVYVGDNPVDLAVADAAGVTYRHVAWGEPVRDDVVRLERFAELCPEPTRS